MREYIGLRHMAQPKPPKQSMAFKFWRRGFGCGIPAGILIGAGLMFGVVAFLSSVH